MCVYSIGCDVFAQTVDATKLPTACTSFFRVQFVWRLAYLAEGAYSTGKRKQMQLLLIRIA